MMEVPAAIWIPTLVVVIVVLLYKYLTKNNDYWKNHGIPFVPPLPLVGSIGGIFYTGKLHEADVEWYKKYGPIYGYFEGSKPILNVADPDLLRNILVKDFANFMNRRNLALGNPIGEKMVTILSGEAWKRVRTIITPAFTTGKIKKMTDIIIESARSMSQRFRDAAEKNVPLDTKRNFGAFAMDVIASSAFATKIDSHNDPDNPFVTMAKKVFEKKFNWRIMMFFLFPKVAQFLGISFFEMGPVIDFFKEVTLKIIEERKRTKKVRNDFLQMMMDSTTDAGTEGNEKDIIDDSSYGDNNSQIFQNTGCYKSLTHVELIAQCIVFFIAGYDTTASTLAFALYELALNPDCQERTISEIDSSIQDNECQLTYDAVQSMKYLDQVISETLRKYPVAVKLERLSEGDYKLGHKGLMIPKGMPVAISVYAMHHDPKFYPEPEKFKPERFTAEEKGKRHPYVYLPFGAGPRNCLGMRFAMMEIKICLAYLLSQFRFKKSPKTKVPLDLYSGQGILQPVEILVAVECRKDKIFRG